MRVTRSSRGFLLVEALLAFTILLLGAVVCFYGFSRNLKVSQELGKRQVRISGLQAVLLKSVR